MPITVQLVIDNPTPAHGDTITATYVVHGNDGTPAQADTITGQAEIGGEHFDVGIVITKPAIDPLPESFGRPVGDGLTFSSTEDPAVWTALIP